MIVEVLGLPPRAVRQDLRAPQLLSLGFTYCMGQRFRLGQIPDNQYYLEGREVLCIARSSKGRGQPNLLVRVDQDS